MDQSRWYRLVRKYYSVEKRALKKELGLPAKEFRKYIDDIRMHFSTKDKANWEERANDYLLTMIWPQLQGNIAALLAQECEILEEESRILDAGCGIGLDICFLAKNFENLLFVGTDSSTNMLNETIKRKNRYNLDNVELTICSYSQLLGRYGPQSFDLLIVNGPGIDWHDDDEIYDSVSNFYDVLKNESKMIFINHIVPEPALLEAGFQTETIVKFLQNGQGPEVFYCTFLKTGEIIIPRYGKFNTRRRTLLRS